MAKNNIKLLGDLEAEIMEVVWKNSQASVRDVLLKLEKNKKLAYTTVMTVMSRLCEKGILNRKMDKSGTFVYAPTKDKESFYQNASGKLIKGFLKEYGDVAVAHFFDFIESSDTKQSEEWKNKLKELVK